MRRVLTALALPAFVLLLGGCDRAADRQPAEHAAAETSLGMTTRQFARHFNREVPAVLAAMGVDEPEHMARLYQLDPARLHPGQYEYVLDTQVGPTQTTLIGTLNKQGELRSVGVLLTDRTQAAHDAFLVCANSAARSFMQAAPDKLNTLVERLASVALNNPGQRMTEVVASQLLSVEVVPQGLLFQIQPQQ